MNLPLFDIGAPKFDPELSQWFTPADLAARIVAWCGGLRDLRVLEPSAGDGALIRQMLGRESFAIRVDAHEIDPRHATTLKSLSEKVVVHVGDYLKQPPPVARFDVAVMNPPYEDGLDGEFLSKAMDESDRIVAVLRTVALNGQERGSVVWRRCKSDGDFAMVGLAFLSRRPAFSGIEGAKADFCVVKLSRRSIVGDASCQPEWW